MGEGEEENAFVECRGEKGLFQSTGGVNGEVFSMANYHGSDEEVREREGNICLCRERERYLFLFWWKKCLNNYLFSNFFLFFSPYSR